jgi:hypothetical protein
VRAIYDEREPHLRRLPMAPYLFGAYDSSKPVLHAMLDD